MKKIITLMIISTMMFTLVGCQIKSKDNENTIVGFQTESEDNENILDIKIIDKGDSTEFSVIPIKLTSE